MSNITITGKLTNPFGPAVDGDQVALTAPTGNHNLAATVTDAEALKNAVDNLRLSGISPLDNSRLSSLETKVDVLYPLSTDVEKLSDFASIYDDSHTVQNVQELSGYSLFADYRELTDQYSSSGVNISTSASEVTVSGLGTNLYRTFGFKVDAPSALTLLEIVDNSIDIPFLRMTAEGHFEINDYTPGHTSSEVVSDRPTRLDLSSGSQPLTAGSGTASFNLPVIPTDATGVTRRISMEADVFLNGEDSLAGHFFDINDVPDTVTSQSKRTQVFNIPLGPLHGNRVVSVTIGYAFRVMSGILILDITLETAPSDITVTFQNGTIYDSFTAQTTSARVDNWRRFQDVNGDYSFTGEQEFLMTFHPRQDLGTTEAVAASVDSSGNPVELNDIGITIPDVIWETIKFPDEIELRTFSPEHFLRHSDLSHLLTQRGTKWAYGLARLNTVRERQFTQAIDLASGTTINGATVPKGENVVYQATGTGTSITELRTSVALPSNYSDWAYVHITEYDNSSLQWRHTEFPTQILSSGNVSSNDNIRLQGSTVLAWVSSSRELSMNPSAQEIYRVSLKD